MAVDITTPKATAPDPPEQARVSGWELFRWTYRFFYSKTVGLVLILAMAALVLIGTLRQQLAKVFHGFESFDVYRSPLFAVVSGLLAASILACTAHRLPLLWRSWRHPRLVVPARAYEAARYRASVPVDGGDSEVMSQVREVLAKQRYRVLTDPDHPKAVYADRFAWGGMGAVVSHLSFVIIIAAVVISMNGGIDKMVVVPTTGTPVGVEGTSLRVAATSYEASHTAEGRPTDYVSHLVVTKKGKQVGEKDVRVNSPLRVGSVSFYQSAWVDGIALAVEASGAAEDVVIETDGKPFDGFAPLLGGIKNFDLVYGVVDLNPDEGLRLMVAVPEFSDPVTITIADGTAEGTVVDVKPGQALLELYRDGMTVPLATQLVDNGAEWTVGDYVFTLDGPKQHPVIQVRQDPGEPLMWTGSILLVLGMTVVFACRQRRLWVTWDAASSRIRFASTDKSDTAWARRFNATVEAVAQAVDSAAHHGPALGRTAGDSTESKVDEQVEASDLGGTKEKTDE